MSVPCSSGAARRQLLALAMAPAFAGGAAAYAPEPARMGLHGMALFGGREGLYASHLPMFHSPHDVQVLMRIALCDAQADARLRDTLARAPQLWTLEPEPFDLSRLQPGAAAPLSSFSARLVQGHFERGGVTRWAKVQIDVKALLLFNRLLPGLRQAERQRFFWFGQGREQFLVKWLDQRPDVDLIGRFDNAGVLGARRLLSLPAGPLKPPPAAALLAALRAQGARPLAAPQWLYAETGDLA